MGFFVAFQCWSLFGLGLLGFLLSHSEVVGIAPPIISTPPVLPIIHWKIGALHKYN